MNYNNLDVWKRSVNLSIAIYRTLAKLKDFGFKDQITRSSLSVPSNIAEGYERELNKEFIRYLYIPKFRYRKHD